eukprot:7177514-Prymnesium_polylepis.1
MGLADIHRGCRRAHATREWRARLHARGGRAAERRAAAQLPRRRRALRPQSAAAVARAVRHGMRRRAPRR